MAFLRYGILSRVPKELLAFIWPIERVEMGLLVNKGLNADLPKWIFCTFVERKVWTNVTKKGTAWPIAIEQALNVMKKFRNVEVDIVSVTVSPLSLHQQQLLRCHGTVTSSRRVLARLDLHLFELGDQGAEKLEEVLRAATMLEHLDLRESKLGPAGAAHVATLCETTARLLHLDLSANYIGSQGVESVAARVRSFTSLQHLDLRGTGIDSEGAEHVATLCGMCTKLTHLDLSMNELGNAGATSVAEVLGQNLEFLSLELNDIIVDENDAVDVEGATRLANALRRCKKLAFADFSSNSLGDFGMKKLADVLVHAPELQHLDVSNTEIGPYGAQAVAMVIGACPKLVDVDLSENKIGNEVAEALGSRWYECRVQRLNLHDIEMGPAGAQRLAEALRDSPELARLDLSGNYIGDVGAHSLAYRLLGSLTSLGDLNLSANDVGDAGADSLGAILGEGSALERLDMRDNRLRSDARQALSKAGGQHCQVLL